MGPDLAKVGLKFRCMEVYKCMRGAWSPGRIPEEVHYRTIPDGKSSDGL